MSPTDTGSDEDARLLEEIFSGPDPVKVRKESSIERSFVKWCRSIQLKQRKMEEGEGYPDRQIFLGHGRVCCIEFKKPGGKARKRQEIVHQELEQDGVPVLVTSSLEEAKLWVEQQLRIGSPTSISEPLRSSSTRTP